MDNFVKQLADNRNIEDNTKSGKSCLRAVLYYVSMSSPQVKIRGNNGCNSNGDISFEVPIRTLGFSDEVFERYRKQICSKLMVNFLGELLIRDNINYFANVLINIDPEDFQAVVDRFEHKNFGMDIQNDRLIFDFHISLLQGILTEDLEKEIK